MKLRKLAGLGIATVAAASFSMVCTAAMASHHSAGKNVKCAVTTCKDGKACEVMISKPACDQLGGAVKTASAPKVSSAAVPAATDQTTQVQPDQQQTVGQQTAAATTPNADQN